MGVVVEGGFASDVEWWHFDAPSGAAPGKDPEHDARVCAAAAKVLTDAEYGLTSEWSVPYGFYVVDVDIPYDRVIKEMDEQTRVVEAAIEGLAQVEEETAREMFEAAEIPSGGNPKSWDPFEDWATNDINIVFYRTEEGEILARPVSRFERPRSKLTSVLYGSAALVSVHPNPRSQFGEDYLRHEDVAASIAELGVFDDLL
jgi:hypothetical protein